MVSRLVTAFFMAVILNTAIVEVSFAGEKSFVRPGRYLIKYKNTPRKQKPKLILVASEGNRKHPKLYHRASDKCGGLKRLNKNIEKCSADFLVNAEVGDPFVGNCTNTVNCAWGIENTNNTDVNLQEAWQITEGGPEIVVAVLDTGVDLNHPDIKDNIWTNPNEIPDNNEDDDHNGWVDDVHGINTIDDSTNVQDDNGHGTHVSGIIAAIRGNDIGIAGVAPKVKILPVKILDNNGGGLISSAVAGLDYIADLAENHDTPIFVVNNSWGASISQTTFLLEAFDRIGDLGILATAAAGNGGTDSIGDNLNSAAFLPAKLPVNNIIAVASIDFNGNLSSFSNYGSNFVHLAAPGGMIRSLLANGVTFGNSVNAGTVNASGTSMSTPFVTGVLALMRAHLTSLTPLQIKDRLLQRVVPLSPANAQKVISGGRLDAYFALTGDEILIPTPQATFTPTNTPLFTATSEFTPSIIATSTPVPTIIIASPTPEATIASVPTQIDISKVSGMLKIFPVNLMTISEEQSRIAAKRSNIIDARLLNPASNQHYNLKVFNDVCLIKEIPITEKLVSTLQIKAEARKLKTLRFQLTDSTGQVVSERNVPVTGGPKKGNTKVSCKLAKKNVVITGSHRSL